MEAYDVSALVKSQGVQIGVLHDYPQSHGLARQLAHRAAAIPCNGASDLVADQLAALIQPVSGHRSALAVLDLDPDTTSRACGVVDLQLTT